MRRCHRPSAMVPKQAARFFSRTKTKQQRRCHRPSAMVPKQAARFVSRTKTKQQTWGKECVAPDKMQGSTHTLGGFSRTILQTAGRVQTPSDASVERYPRGRSKTIIFHGCFPPCFSDKIVRETTPGGALSCVLYGVACSPD